MAITVHFLLLLQSQAPRADGAPSYHVQAIQLVKKPIQMLAAPFSLIKGTPGMDAKCPAECPSTPAFSIAADFDQSNGELICDMSLA